MTIDPRFAGALGAYGLYNAPPAAASPLQVMGPNQRAAATQAQNANFDPDLTFHGQSTGVDPRELEEAANILQYASMDELHLAFSQGPPELKDLVNKELQRRIASGDPSPKQEETGAPPAAPPPASTPTSPPPLSVDMPAMPSASLRGTGGPGNDPPNATPALQALPRAFFKPATITAPRPGPLSVTLPVRQKVVALRPPLTRGAIAPMARVPARLGAPRGAQVLSESDLLNMAEAAKQRGTT